MNQCRLPLSALHLVGNVEHIICTLHIGKFIRKYYEKIKNIQVKK